MGINGKKLAKMKYAAAIHQMIDDGRFPITLEQYCYSKWSVPCLGDVEKSFFFQGEPESGWLDVYGDVKVIGEGGYKYLVENRGSDANLRAANWIMKCRPFRKAKTKRSVDPFLDSYEWRKLRMEAIKKYGARCQCCGATPADGAVINVDHIKPRMKFPELSLSIDNLQVLCNVCNHGKGNWDSTDWR